MRTNGPEEVQQILKQLEQNIAAVVERRRRAEQQSSNYDKEQLNDAYAQPLYEVRNQRSLNNDTVLEMQQTGQNASNIAGARETPCMI